ncbi:MAG TPA: hypothetical protein VKT53_12380 [Candidatus Acidoferrum sp.]|nr:hypothetical protein [Candidatus Acidoferrum sp.]
MRSATSCVALFLSLLLLYPLAAQQASAPPASASALLQSSLAAQLGNTQISDVTLTGAARRIAGSDDESGTVTYRALAAGAARYDFAYSSGPRTEVRAALSVGASGAWTGPDGVSHPLAIHNLANRSDIFPSFTLAPVLSSANSIVTLVGLENKNGQSVYHVSVSQQFPQMKPDSAALAQHLTQTEIFLDASTLLPVAIDFNTHPDDNSGIDIPVELVFSDYRSVSGSQIPFRVQKFLNGGLVLDLQFQTASINTGLPASLFNVQ